MAIQIQTRKTNGAAILELAIIAVLLVAIAMFCVDVLILALGSGLNERASRDAARMAAQSSSYGGALLLAQTAVKAYQGDGYFVTTPTVDAASFTYNDFGGNPPADTSPYVQVTTNTTVRIPAPVFLWGVNFGSNGTMTFSKTYTFPIVTTAAY